MRTMSKSRALFAVLGAVLALAVTAVAAQATQGPYYKVSGARLASGSTKVMTLSANGNTLLSWFGGSATCTGVTGLSGTKIAGSSGANSATAEATLEYTGCTVSGWGEGCQVENGKITTSLLKGTLGYGTSSRTGKLEMLLGPASGTTFMTIHFHAPTGSECRTTVLQVLGHAVIYVHNGSSAAEVGVNEAQATKNEIEFKSNGGTKIWTESAGTLTEAVPNLAQAGFIFIITSKVFQELEGLPEWGTFTA